MTGSRRTLDVSHLPTSAMDERSPLWCGNLLLVFIETTTLAILLASYFDLRQNYDQWPPPKVDVHPPILHPVPDLGAATADIVLMVAACLPMYWTDVAARRKQRGRVTAGLALMLAVSVAALVLRAYELPATKFWWNDNAYASTVWTTLVLHGTYQLAAAAEFFIMGVWIVRHGLDEKHALDVTLAGGSGTGSPAPARSCTRSCSGGRESYERGGREPGRGLLRDDAGQAVAVDGSPRRGHRVGASVAGRIRAVPLQPRAPVAHRRSPRGIRRRGGGGGGGATLLAWRDWRRVGGGEPRGTEEGLPGRSRFLAALGVATSGLFAVVILAQWVPTFFLDPGWY